MFVAEQFPFEGQVLVPELQLEEQGPEFVPEQLPLVESEESVALSSASGVISELHKRVGGNGTRRS